MPSQSPMFLKTRSLQYFIFALLVVGLGGIVAQTILLRELLILFSGNEFSIGIIIGSWVIWEAIGAFSGGKWGVTERKNIAMLVWVIILFSIVFPSSIYLARIFKIIIGIPPEIGVGILPILYSSFIILLPTGFLHGLLFTMTCSIHNQITGEGPSSVGKVYFYEMLGTIIGGILVNYLFIPHYHSFQIAMAAALLNAIACLLLVVSFPVKRGYFVLVAAILLLLSSFAFLAGNGADKAHHASITTQWQDKNLIYYENSFYQNIAVVQNENQYTFFSDGVPLITTPVPDIAFVEEFVHFPLLFHAFPQEILVLSGGAGGVINEILKYPTVKRVDYVEIDPFMLKTIQKFSTPLTGKELNNPLVYLHYLDGRIFVKDAPKKYDVVLLGMASPQTLQANRFFTQEFFTMVKGILKEKGIFAFTLTGSLVYYNKELKDFNRCILTTLEKVFPHQYVIPGDFNIFMASNSKGVFPLSPALLYGRLDARKVRTNLLTFSHLTYRLEERWHTWFYASIKDGEASINRDFSPRGLFYNIAYNNLLFSPSLKTVFDWTKRIDFFWIVVFILLLFFTFLLFQKKYNTISVMFAIGTTGFTAMMFELILLFSFQVYYGYVFYEAGIFITLFMGGMALGSLVITSRLRSIRRDVTIFASIEMAIVVFALLLFFIFQYLDFMPFSRPALIHILFLFLLFLAGFLTGMEFPLANKIYLKHTAKPGSETSDPIGKTVGLLYGVDLFGGWIGGMIGGFVLLPMLGLFKSCIMLAVLKTGSFLLLLTFSKK